VHDAGVDVGLESHKCATAADFEELLLHQQACFVGERDQLDRGAQEHMSEGRAGAIRQQLHVDAHAVVALRVELEQQRFDSFERVLLEISRDYADEF
jgi:hypothetical protein